MSWGVRGARRAAEVAGAGRSALGEARREVCLGVVVDASCPRWLAASARDALVPDRGGARLVVSDEALDVAAGGPCDAVLVLAGRDGGAAAAAARSLAATAPTALVAPPVPGRAAPEGAALVEVPAADETPARLGAWLGSACAHPLAVASAFPVCRSEVCADLARSCAAKNAAVAALSPGHGADLPVMCANQVGLALDMAAAHGRRLGAGRLAEAAGVCALGVLWRSCARALAARVPLPARATGALVGAAGTLATAAALSARLSLEGLAARGAAPAAARAPRATEGRDDGYVTIGEA